MYHHDHHPTSLGGRCWDTLQAMTAGNAMNACTHPRSLALCSTPYKSEQLHALKSCTLARGDNPDRQSPVLLSAQASAAWRRNAYFEAYGSRYSGSV